MLAASLFRNEQETHEIDRAIIDGIKIDRPLQPGKQAKKMLQAGNASVRQGYSLGQHQSTPAFPASAAPRGLPRGQYPPALQRARTARAIAAACRQTCREAITRCGVTRSEMSTRSGPLTIELKTPRQSGERMR